MRSSALSLALIMLTVAAYFVFRGGVQVSGTLHGSGAGAAKCAARSGPLPDTARADRVVVDKSERMLFLYNDGGLLRSYTVSLGRNPRGHKQEEGDSRTPEGLYTVDYRNRNSAFHLSLHISYPNSRDTDRARARGVSPGGDIMIHGLPNGLGDAERHRLARDWTDGCVAVLNSEIEDIWRLVPDGTPIEILP